MGEFSMMELLLRYFLGNLSVVMLFIAPLLTMRLYAEERKSGTIELLFTYPVTDAAAVAGKFAACLTALSVLLAGDSSGCHRGGADFNTGLEGHFAPDTRECFCSDAPSSRWALRLDAYAQPDYRGRHLVWRAAGALVYRWGKGMGGPGWGSVLEYVSVANILRACPRA